MNRQGAKNAKNKKRTVIKSPSLFVLGGLAGRRHKLAWVGTIWGPKARYERALPGLRRQEMALAGTDRHTAPVTVWRSGNVAEWQSGAVALWRCGAVAV